MKLSVIIPVYNEAATLEAILKRVQDVPIEKEIVIVDDCSQDATPRILKKLEQHYDNLRIFRHEVNKGKGAALRTAIEHVSGDITIIQDADLEYSPEEFPGIIRPIEEGSADVVYGSRFLGTHRVFMFWHHLGNKFLTFLTNLLYNTNITDMETCYKAFKTKYLKQIDLQSNRFDIEPEITAKVFRLGLRVFEVPISYEGRGYEEGKKIGWKDGLVAIWTLLKYRFWVRSIGEETLKRISVMKKFNWWIYNRIKKHVGMRVFEGGCGNGLFAKFLRDREIYFGLDMEKHYIDDLKDTYADASNMAFEQGDLKNLDTDRLKEHSFDTVLSINVLEHLENDDAALDGFNRLLPKEGKLILLVPALPSLYCNLDRNLDHKRRYTIAGMKEQLVRHNFRIVQMNYLNMFGAIGWWFSGKVLRRNILPKSQLSIYESFVPIFRKFESLVGPPFGLSILAICEKQDEPNTQQ